MGILSQRCPSSSNTQVNADARDLHVCSSLSYKQKCKRDTAMPPYDFAMMRISPICLQVC